jgi:hypothetical protein
MSKTDEEALYIDSDLESNDEKTIKKKEKKTSSAQKKPFKKMSENEITEYLKDSILIPNTDWNKLSIGSNISYYKNDGNFVKSGFIKAIYNNEGNDFIKYGTKLNTYFNDKYYKEFTVNTNNIKELYKKIDQSAILEYKIIKKNILNSMNSYMEKFTKIENDISTLSEKISKLEENHIKTIKFIKKLHNIKSLDDVKNI